MSSAPDCGLIIFLRFPELGKVKTRIAETAGDETAFKVYQELSDITLHLAASLFIPTYLFYENRLPDELIPSFHYQKQIEGNLGEKIVAAFDYVLQRHQKAVIIGSDCPEISPTDIMHAIELLDQNDIVIGPTEDGGYYLLGCKEKVPALFDSIEWSTSIVFQQTIKKIEEQGFTYSLMRTLSDIDTEEDWIRYKARLTGPG